jgi:RNA polymerase sigma factor (sigma-70 family)
MDQAEEIDFITRIARRVKAHHDCCGLTLHDLINEGWIVFAEMKGEYDPSMNVSLESYCYKRVKGAMLDLIKAEHPRGYRKDFRPGHDAPVKVVEFEDVGETPDIETELEFRHVNKVIVRRLTKRARVILIERAAGEELKPLARRFHLSLTRVYQIHRESQGIIRKVMVRRKRR